MSPVDIKVAQQQLWKPSHPRCIHYVYARQQSIPVLSIFEKICSAYFGYQKGIEWGLLSRARTFSGRMVPEMLAVGEGGIYRFLRLRSQANPLGLAKMSTAVGSEGHSGPQETLHDSSLPNQTTTA